MSTVDDAEIVAIADIDGARARAVAEEHGASAYESAAEMLDSQTLDAVWIVTPPAFHREPFVEAAQRGVHVYVEKPVALNMTDALAMEEAANRAGILAAVSYQIRYLDTVAEVHRTFESKDLALLNAHYYWPSPGRWALDTAMSGGQIVEQATHLADLMRYWAGDVETVHAAYTPCGPARVTQTSGPGTPTPSILFSLRARSDRSRAPTLCSPAFPKT